MPTFVLVHGSTRSLRAWDLVKAELERQNHTVITPELPADGPSSGAERYAEVIATSVPRDHESVVVAHSAAGWFLPLVAARCKLARMVFLAATVPRIGMSFMELLQAEPEMLNPAWIGKDPRNVAVADEFLLHDCPPELRNWAHNTIRIMSMGSIMSERYPLDQWPQMPASYIVCSQDRTIQPAWSRRIARERLCVEPFELSAGHCPYISMPKELAELLSIAH